MTPLKDATFEDIPALLQAILRELKDANAIHRLILNSGLEDVSDEIADLNRYSADQIRPYLRDEVKE